MRLVALLFKASYQLRHHEWGAILLDRWLTIVLVVLAGLCAAGLIPGRLAGVVVCGVLLLALIAIGALAARRQYVVFSPETPGPRRSSSAARLHPADKLLLRATGLFEVEGKEQRFADLQAYFRSFQTREHAVMAIVPPSRALVVGNWPADQIGMWYIFFKGPEIRRIDPGWLSFGWQTWPALAIDVEQVSPPPTSPLDVWGGYRSGNQKPKTRQQTIYLSFESPADRQAVLDDLLADSLPSLQGFAPSA